MEWMLFVLSVVLGYHYMYVHIYLLVDFIELILTAQIRCCGMSRDVNWLK